MAAFQVLVTDYAWPDLDVERRILAEVDAELIVAERQDVDHFESLARGADAILTCWAQVPRQVIAAVPKCLVVSRFGIGLDNIDVEFCTRQRIPVTNVPDYCAAEVAEHTVALLLSLARNVALYHHATKCGQYDLNAGPQMRRLEGRTLGVIGFGGIGQRVAEKARALGMQIFVFSRRQRRSSVAVRWCDLDQLLSESDFVSLHIPLTEETRQMISTKQLKKMKPSAFLINTSRGGLVDHQALATALADGIIAGAALDVQDPEPPNLTAPPYNDPRVIVTPHAAFVSAESLEELRRRAAENVAVCLRGDRPADVVNPQVYEPL